MITGGRISVTEHIASKRAIPGRRITYAFGVARKRVSAIGRIFLAIRIEVERAIPGGGIIRAARPVTTVTKKRLRAISRVVVAGRIVEQGAKSHSRVGIADGVVKERLMSGGRVRYPAGQTEEGLTSLGCVAAGIASVRRRNDCLRVWQKCKADNC